MLIAGAQVLTATVVICLILPVLVLLLLMDLVVKVHTLLQRLVAYHNVTLVLPGKLVMEKVHLQSLVLLHLLPMLELVHQAAKCPLQVVLVVKLSLTASA
jgi:hypothetical protein